MPFIRIIIVNYNAGETITGCIQAALESGEQVQITIFDNDSGDGSVALVKQRFASLDNVEVIENTENIGFARAVNTTAQHAIEDFLLILNPDCELFPGAVENLKQALENDSGAALAGPMVVNRQGVPQRGTLRRFPDPWKSFMTVSGLWRLGSRFHAFKGIERDTGDVPDSNLVAEAVSGACMLVRRDRFKDVGGMDESYGLHCEDLDLMYRLHLDGYHCLLVPTAQVFHKQGVSSRSRPLWVHLQKHLGMQRFFRKFQTGNHGFVVRWLVISGIWLRYVLTLPRVLLQK